MATLRVFPFSSVDPTSTEAIELAQWEFEDDFLKQAGASKDIYDPALESVYVRRFKLNSAKFAEEAHQGPLASFALMVELLSSHTGLRSCHPQATILATDAELEGDMVVEINNCDYGGRLTFTTKVVLVRPDPTQDLAASVPGSILYQDVLNYDVEDYFDGFPHLSPENLSRFLGLMPGPVWVINVDTSDLELDRTQAVTVSINGETDIGKALQRGKADVVMLRKALLADLCRAMVNAALDCEEFCDALHNLGRSAFSESPNSIGRTLLANLAMCGFHEPPGECRAMRQAKPFEFEARIQNHAFRVQM